MIKGSRPVVARKKYDKPGVTHVTLDYTISLVMKSHPDKPPKNNPPNPRGAPGPFASPFGDRTFD